MIVNFDELGALVTTVFDPPDEGPSPTTFVAVTVNEYRSPLVRPITVHCVAEGPLAVHV